MNYIGIQHYYYIIEQDVLLLLLLLFYHYIYTLRACLYGIISDSLIHK